jgi:hypothetical protein
MSDQLTRAEASRRNGARSQGPTSTQGKARSSQNARTHGLTARDLSLTPAEQEIYDAHFDGLVEIWNPTRSYELFLVSRLARVEFLSERAERLQHALTGLQTDLAASEITRTFEVIDETGALALGFRSLNDKSTAHTTLDRHLARLSREALRLRDALKDTIAMRPSTGAPVGNNLEFANEPDPPPATPTAANSQPEAQS